jgi:hypothetical protein
VFYLFLWALPSFLLSVATLIFARRELGKQRRFWLKVISAGFLPAPFIAFLFMLGLAFMRDTDDSALGGAILTVGTSLACCLFGVAAAIALAPLKPVKH